jgi:flagellar basal-body rod modification protein FlgD
MVTTIGSLFAPAAKETANKDRSLLEANADTFLSLFLTQLKNQDPTQPFDTKDMATSMAQLNNAKQAVEQNKKLEELITMQGNTQAGAIANFIGKDIEYLGDTFYSGTTGESKLAYVLDNNVDAVQIKITDDGGNVVHESFGATTSGRHNITWDGLDSSGNHLPEGRYKIEVTSRRADSAAKSELTLVQGVVSGVDFASQAEPSLSIGTANARVSVGLGSIAFVNNFTGNNNQVQL